jgi:hypothetical protein
MTYLEGVAGKQQQKKVRCSLLAVDGELWIVRPNWRWRGLKKVLK